METRMENFASKGEQKIIIAGSVSEEQQAEMILIAKIFLVESRIKYLVGEVYDK
jgi:hypothetical protein